MLNVFEWDLPYHFDPGTTTPNCLFEETGLGQRSDLGYRSAHYTEWGEGGGNLGRCGPERRQAVSSRFVWETACLGDGLFGRRLVWETALFAGPAVDSRSHDQYDHQGSARYLLIIVMKTKRFFCR